MKLNANPNSRHLRVLCTLVVILLLGTIISVKANGGEVTGSWQNQLYISPVDGEFLDNFTSIFNLSFSSQGITYSSRSVFKEDRFVRQSFEVDSRLGIAQLSSTASFDTEQTRLDYWLKESSFTLAATDFTVNLLLEGMEENLYGVGLEGTVSGNLTENTSARFTSRFGMEEDRAETLGLEYGSGYSIVTSHGEEDDVYGPSQLQYVESELEVTGLLIGCCEYDFFSRFSDAEGFESVDFRFDIEPDGHPVGFQAELSFTPKSKSIELNPSLVAEWFCFDVYTELATPHPEDLLDEDTSLIEGVRLKGFGLSNISMGYITVSSLTAMEGNLWAPGIYHIDYRADDYLLEPSPLDRLVYEETSYDQVFSIYKSDEEIDLTFGADVYFDMENEEMEASSLFDTALFTGRGDYNLNEQFSLGAGLAIKPEMLEALRFGLNYSF